MVAEIRTRRNLTEKANCKQSKISGHAWTDTGLSQKFANGLQNRLSEPLLLERKGFRKGYTGIWCKILI